MLSANAAPESATRLLTAGADDHVTKPVDPQQFRERVQAALQQYKPPQAQPVSPTEPSQPAGPNPAAPGKRRAGLLRPLGWLFGRTHQPEA